MSIKYRLNKPKRKPAHWSKERYEEYLKDYAKENSKGTGGKDE